MNKSFELLKNETSFDGLLLDMNEVTTDINGEILPKFASSFLSKAEEGSQLELSKTWYQSCNSTEKSDTKCLPFVPGDKSLDSHTLSLDATGGYDTKNGESYQQAGWHSVFGLYQTKVINNLTQQFYTDKRTFVSSRSTFSSSGKYGHHVLGSHFKSLADMEYAIAGVMNFNMFGIPTAGPNVCNPSNSTDWDKDCASWMRLATYLPFAKQHLQDKYMQKEIWIMNEPYRTQVKNSLFERLQYLRMTYGCIFKVSMEGGTCVEPMFFENDVLFDGDEDHST